MAGAAASADETGAKSKFDEHRVEFRNQGVKLAGSLLLPKSEVPVPAVVFVHGAGRQTREAYREVGEYFASRGIAALIYDKRGTGQSGGAYESYEPYENLVNDALSAIAFLKERREIAASQIGIWGLSQGAYISAVASSRSEDIQFIIVVGADATDGNMFYYRDNLFRRYGLSRTLRDMAEKLHLVEQDLRRTFQDGFRLSSFVPRSYPPPDQYVHPAWSHVHKPVLAMWGQLDQHIPVGESVAGLKNSLAQANNENWTFIILPRTNHDLKISETGALQSKSHGYPPGALQTMTDWAWSAIDRPSEIGKMKQEGVAPEAGILPKLASYERLRWYGNGIVQAALWILFLISFSANTIAGAWCCLAGLFRRGQSVALPVGKASKDQIALFAKQSEALRTEFCECASTSAAAKHIAALAKTFHWKTIALHTGELTDAIAEKLPDTLGLLRINHGYKKEELEACDAGLTECESLIAQTGSVCVTGPSSGGRALSVLPPHHIVIAHVGQLLPDLSAAYESLARKYREKYPSFISFITGPSRTGDIERILVLGAHGPKRLTVLLIA